MKTRNEELASLADRLLPYLLPVVRQTAQAGSGAGTASLTQHALDGGFHTGTLSWSRVNKAGSSLADMATRNYADLTNRAHVLATNAGLGPDHTIGGATAGHVLRASGAAAAAFAQLQHGDLGGVGPNDHHNRQHGITSASDHTVTGSSWDVIALTGTNTLGVRTPVADTTAGTLEGLLKSNAAGGLELVFLDSAELRNNAGSITLNPTGTAVLPTGSIQKDLGDYNRKWRTLYAAELYVETLVAQDVIATIGGRVTVAPTTTLIADLSSGATTIDVKHNGFVVNEYLYMATAPGGLAQVEVLRITAGPTTITGGFRYTVTRNVDGSGANSWVAGDAVISLGNAVGNGIVEITATSTLLSHLGPSIVTYARSSTATWNSLVATTVQGNLRSFVDYGADEFGFALGNNLTLTPTTGFSGMTADRTNGLRLFNVNFRLYESGAEYLSLTTTSGMVVRAAPSGGIAGNRGITFTDGTNNTGGMWSYYNGADFRSLAIRSGYSGLASQSILDMAAQGTGDRRVTVSTGAVYTQIETGGANGSRITLDATPTGTVRILAGTVTIQDNTAWHAGNDGAGSGLDAGFLYGNGPTASGNRWGVFTTIGSDGVMEIGRYLDFHETDASTADFSSRITSTGGTLLTSGAFTTGGALTTGGQLTVNSGAGLFTWTGGYAVQVSGGSGIYMAAASSGYIYRTAGTLRLAVDGGNVMQFADSGGGSSMFAVFGGSTALYSARITAYGNVHVTGAVTGELYLQTAAGSVPGAAAGFARIALRSSDNALVAVMPSGAVRVLATN